MTPSGVPVLLLYWKPLAFAFQHGLPLQVPPAGKDAPAYHFDLTGGRAVVAARGVAVVAVERASDLAGLATRVPCDVLLLDLQMERSSLLEIETLKRQMRILVVTASEQLDDAVLAMQLGARGVVPTHFAIETLMEAIRAVADGKTWVPPGLRGEMTKRHREPMYKGLTRREYEIVRHAVLGMRNVEIARRLFISEVTVKTHLSSVF